FKYWMDKEKILLENTLTVVDELALPLEKLRLRGRGSDAGHNGLKDIQQTLGTDAYPKLRFGIGNHFPKGMQADFVLGKWQKEEMSLVTLKIQSCIEIIESFAAIGLDRTMSSVNNQVYKEE
ncbi:MAG: aminoacyl-tRNA hydrolase, partial [Ferruginibacter sp.]